ncbi:hypothetical protein I7I48_09345 [Histoplasma ohiense]|nr:hypothetical protein I7I48_09345 [Histoplasma ohiense (nom. inval.)]
MTYVEWLDFPLRLRILILFSFLLCYYPFEKKLIIITAWGAIAYCSAPGSGALQRYERQEEDINLGSCIGKRSENSSAYLQCKSLTPGFHSEFYGAEWSICLISIYIQPCFHIVTPTNIPNPSFISAFRLRSSIQHGRNNLAEHNKIDSVSIAKVGPRPSTTFSSPQHPSRSTSPRHPSTCYST